MKITRASDYAMRALLHIAEKPQGTIFMRSDLAKISNIPDSFLGKIMQSLAKADILVSERGKRGGFRLEKKTDEITMLDVIIAIEGELLITECLDNTDFCNRTCSCNIHKAWGDIQNKISDQLKSVTLKDLMS